MPMTKQEYYDLLVACAGDGRFPAALHDASGAWVCKYRLGDKKCAVGLLIPDERYLPELENKKAVTADVRDAVDGDLPEGLSFEDLGGIQWAHDRSFRVDEGNGWSRKGFMEKLNGLTCFGDITKKEVA